GATEDLQRPVAALYRGAAVPGAPRIQRGVFRGADDRDGYGDQEFGGDDREPDVVYEQSPAGRDHEGNHRGGVGSRSAVSGPEGPPLKVMTEKRVGKIVQIIGPVLDIEFEAGHLPEIYNALQVRAESKEAGVIDLVAEVEQHLGENRVRA